MTWLIITLFTFLTAGLAYWLLVTTEGVFLGRRVVVWLYDLTAHRYDGVKEFSPEDERILVTNPVLVAVQGVDRPLVLDVATGTGRVVYDLLQAEAFTGTVIGLDASWPMLAVAKRKLQAYGQGQQTLLQGVAGRLPFGGDAFDLVTCLEALEFFPRQEEALREMVRVLRPGSALLVTRRTGHEGRFFLHRYRSEAQFVALLGRVGLTNIRIFNWEVGYDLAIGWKGTAGAAAVDSAAGLVYNGQEES